ncbi:RNA polymerase sigma factor [Sphingosinicella sp. CPCC 101087]|uniref:RNA polymerase sigma factor n=1 Tax=Sphingosinicella sp. CPCC 101087 TaxID=2497754 RepID=UPI00101B8EFA|nr:RNA polymerase sigma factor [Sphingosinicella sp. CPCC 101087]
MGGEPGNGGESQIPDSWEDLLAAAQGGDQRAYRTFLMSILPFVRAVARRHSWSDDSVEDIVQDSLLTLHRVRHTYRPGHPVRPWLAAITTRRAIDAGRRSGRIQARETSDPSAYETFADPAANSVEAAQAAESVTRMMNELTPKQREALELVKLKEYSMAEASAASGQSVASLKVNVHRAMRRLRKGREAEEES